MSRSHLYAHVIWGVRSQEPLLTRTIRTVLLAHLQTSGEQKGIRVLHAGGAADHIHVLLYLQPAQNLSQLVRQLKTETADWLNATKLIPTVFEWEDTFAAYSVSPHAIRQVQDYLDKQDDYHKTKTFEVELEGFEKLAAGSS